MTSGISDPVPPAAPQGAGRLDPSERALSAIIAILGAAAYLLVNDPFDLMKGFDYYGHATYDYYARALLEGRFDVPARVASWESHMAPDGTAYVYHGLLPVLPRLVAMPLLGGALAGVETARWVVLCACAAGALVLHALMLRVLSRVPAGPGRRAWVGMAGLMAWGATPAVFLVAGAPFYHEPITLTFLAAMVFLYVLVGCALGWYDVSGKIVVLSLMGALALHGRLTIALGLLVAAALAWLFELARTRRTRIAPAALAIAIVAASGGLLAWSNVERFGDVRTMHGSMDPGAVDEVMFGPVYWGLAKRAQGDATFNEHGRFNLGRVPANAIAHFLAVPARVDQILGLPVYAFATAQYDARIRQYGFPRWHSGYIGALYLWAAWYPLAALGAIRLARVGRPTVLGAGVLGLGLSALLILSYATVSTRYKLDMWPLVALLGVLGLAALPAAGPALRRALLGLCAAGLLVSLVTGAAAARKQWLQYHANPPGPYAVWSAAYCEDLVSRKGFGPERVAEICTLPDLYGG